MSAKERNKHDQAISATRAALGEEALSNVYEESKKMTLEKGISLALSED